MNNKSFLDYGRMKPSAGSSSSRGIGLKKGAWTPEEDMRLKNYIEKNGEGKWHLIPLNAGLNRCRKSCRLRWVNYLSPNIKRGDFGDDEVDLILRLHKLLGNRWSLIAGRIPGRTGNDVKNFWNTNVQPRSKTQKDEPKPTIDESSQKHGTGNVIMPHVHKISNPLPIAGHNPLPIAAHDDGHLIRSLGDGVVSVMDHGVSDDDMIKEYFDGSIDDQAINEVDDKVGPFDYCSPLNEDAFKF